MIRQRLLIIHPNRPTPHASWRVFKRNRHNHWEMIAMVTSYESAVAVMPTGTVKHTRFHNIEPWR